MEPAPTLRFVARAGAALGPALAPIIRSIWASAGPAPVPEERVLPDGGGALLLNLGPALRTGVGPSDEAWGTGAALISGAQRTWAAVRYPTGARHEQVGVLFWAGGLAALCPEAEGLTEAARLGPLVGMGPAQPLMDGLAERLADLPGLGARVELMAQILTAALVTNGTAGRAPLGAQVMALCAAAPGAKAGELAARSGWSAQHLNRRLRTEGGLSVKGLQRVVRLQAALRALRGAETVGAVGSALRYADQAHFAHELREMTGLSAGALQRLAAPAADRVLSLHAEVQILQGQGGLGP
jgi:AraC-like DNA-binding protein